MRERDNKKEVIVKHMVEMAGTRRRNGIMSRSKRKGKKEGTK